MCGKIFNAYNNEFEFCPKCQKGQIMVLNYRPKPKLGFVGKSIREALKEQTDWKLAIDV